MNKAKLSSAYKVAYSIAETMNESIRHVSVILTPQGQVLASGQNHRNKTHPLNQQFGYAYNRLHSEVAAWLAIRWQEYNRMILINFRFNNVLQLRMSKPCQYCQVFVPTIFEQTWFSINCDTQITETNINDYFRRFYYV